MPLTLQTSGKPKRRIRDFVLLFVGCLLLAAGAYLAFLTLAPQFYMQQTLADWNVPVAHAKEKIKENRLYIPAIKLNITYKSGGEEVLNENAWHRFPERGDPKKGGNFIVAGHRFQLGFSPGQTLRASPFYHIDRLKEGDSIYVDFEGVRYHYKTTKHYEVKSTQVSIENPTDEHRLTLYTCDLLDPEHIREVLEAKLVEKNVDPARKF
ncbi:MAG TPA: class E sortase [Verrucomicrobiae bacterium]|nr:class E sortase [Verrucomicrobiae bacterium]